ncbi:hypothetical protein ACJX0J_038224, partial [Zea mays]
LLWRYPSGISEVINLCLSKPPLMWQNNPTESLAGYLLPIWITCHGKKYVRLTASMYRRLISALILDWLNSMFYRIKFIVISRTIIVESVSGDIPDHCYPKNLCLNLVYNMFAREWSMMHLSGRDISLIIILEGPFSCLINLHFQFSLQHITLEFEGVFNMYIRYMTTLNSTLFYLKMVQKATKSPMNLKFMWLKLKLS